MKLQIIYSSLSGCTKKVAQAIYDSVPAEEKSIHDLKDGEPELSGDIIIFGYWVMGGGPDKETQKYLKSVKGHTVGVFCTLGFYADSAYAQSTINKGVELLKENNELIGSCVVNGAIAPSLMKGFVPGKSVPGDQKEVRWEVMKNHPTEAECALAAERFRERVEIYRRCRELGIKFEPVL